LEAPRQEMRMIVLTEKLRYFTDTAADNFEFGQGTTGVVNSGFEIRDVDAAATRLVIDTSGNVGIGDSAPDSKLSVIASGANGIELAPDSSLATDSSRL